MAWLGGPALDAGSSSIRILCSGASATSGFSHHQWAACPFQARGSPFLSIRQWSHKISLLPCEVVTSSLGIPGYKESFCLTPAPGNPAHPTLQRNSCRHRQPPGTSWDVGSTCVLVCNTADPPFQKSGLPSRKGPHPVPWSCLRLQLPPATGEESHLALV